MRARRALESPWLRLVEGGRRDLEADRPQGCGDRLVDAARVDLGDRRVGVLVAILVPDGDARMDGHAAALSGHDLGDADEPAALGRRQDGGVHQGQALQIVLGRCSAPASAGHVWTQSRNPASAPARSVNGAASRVAGVASSALL